MTLYLVMACVLGVVQVTRVYFGLDFFCVTRQLNRNNNCLWDNGTTIIHRATK